MNSASDYSLHHHILLAQKVDTNLMDNSLGFESASRLDNNVVHQLSNSTKGQIIRSRVMNIYILETRPQLFKGWIALSIG